MAALKGFGIGALLLLAACSALRGEAEPEPLPAQPVMRWDHRPEAAHWTRDTLVALQEHGAVLATLEPVDVAEWCPAYPEQTQAARRAFWAGLLSAIAWHESRHQPEVAGGGGRWIGLMQIAPPTAQGSDCRAQSAGALKDGSANLACAVRIAARQVGRDNEIMGGPGRWRGVARDWAPFRDGAKVADMRGWVSGQRYCAVQ